MNLKLTLPFNSILSNPTTKQTKNPISSSFPLIKSFNSFPSPFNFKISIQNQSRINCITPVDEISLPIDDDTDFNNGGIIMDDEDDEIEKKLEEFSANESIVNQIKEIVFFAGPAVGLWICGPLMSLIDTAVIGQGSSLELAALGPGTVVCDYASYIFMFLSIATSNMVATSLAREGKEEVQHKISILLFVGLACGVGMLILTKIAGVQLLSAFTGPKNLHIVPAANTYVQIRGLAWPAILVGWVAQSASLGMKDSWGPLKALAVASAVNGIGDIVLCCFLGYGIAGAAWATMVSQVVASYMMMESLNKKGFNVYSISVPSLKEFLKIIQLAAPVFVTMVSKVAFYSLLTYSATSMGTITAAAHQVMIQVYCMCTVWGEPLSQTAQSFMPELIFGLNRSLKKARTLLKSLVIIGAIAGSILGVVGTTVPWVLPKLFTADNAVIGEMHKVLFAYFAALVITPSTHSLEGTILAGQDLLFLSFTMSGCFTICGLLVLLVADKGLGLAGIWRALALFQWAPRLKTFVMVFVDFVIRRSITLLRNAPREMWVWNLRVPSSGYPLSSSPFAKRMQEIMEFVFIRRPLRAT